MYERFTDRARKVIQLANEEAQRFNHEYIGTEHILLGLIKEGSGVASYVLRNLGLDLRRLRLEVEKIVQCGSRWVSRDRLPQTPRVKQVIAHAIEEAELLDHNYVGTEHLLLGLVRQEESVAAQVLMNLGLKLEQVRGEVLRLLGREIPVEKNSNVPPCPQAAQPSPERERIRSLERQLRMLRFLLGALIGALAGALLNGGTGAWRGLILGGIVALLGEVPAALAGGITGVLLAGSYLTTPIEWVLSGLWGAMVGMVLAEIGRPPGHRRFPFPWWQRR